MNKLLLMLVCVISFMPLTSLTYETYKIIDKPEVKAIETLNLSGSYIAKSNVKFEVAIVNDDASRIVVQTKSNTFSYKIKLKIGNDYIIRFMKGTIVKELYVTADGPGNMEVDIDFNSNDAAQLCYNEVKDDYNLILLYQHE